MSNNIPPIANDMKQKNDKYIEELIKDGENVIDFDLYKLNSLINNLSNKHQEPIAVIERLVFKVLEMVDEITHEEIEYEIDCFLDAKKALK